MENGMPEAKQIIVEDETLNAVTSDNLFEKINIPLRRISNKRRFEHG